MLKANLRAARQGLEVRRIRVRLTVPVPVPVRRSSKVGGRRRRRMMVRRIGVDLRGERALFWARRMQEERLVERVGEWLEPSSIVEGEGGRSEVEKEKRTLGRERQGVFGKRVFGQRYSVGSEDLDLSEGEGKQDGLELLIETARKQEGRSPGRRRRR